MALSTYAELVATIEAWLDDATAETVAQIPTCIRLVEAEVQTELNDPNQYTSAPLTIVAGQGALPVDFGGIVSIADSTFGNMAQIGAGEFADIIPRTGYPTVFAITDNKISVAPSGSGSITLLYRKGIPPLGTNATNWLLDRMPNVYLYGALCHAEFYGWNDARLPYMKAAYDEALTRLRMDGERRMIGAAPLRPRIRRT